MKKVLAICGSGVATSVMCSNKIRNYCEENGISVDVKAISFGQLNPNNIDADLIVSVNPNLEINVNIPVVSGVSLLTGVGQANTLNQILEILKKED